MPMAQVWDRIEEMNNPRLFAIIACGNNSEKAGEGIIKSIVLRHKCRSHAKVPTFWTDTI